MGKINILDASVADMIAAGEVVERPASVVKELVDNAIDAGSANITVEIKNGGMSYMRVTDNGSGIEADDAGLAFMRHATSKIASAQDLESIYTLGFRGEALSSIAAVSKIRLITKTASCPSATQVLIEGGEMEDVAETGAPDGTTIEVRNLFYNTPARMKFLKKDTTEAGYIADVMEKFVLARPDIAFRFINNGKQQLLSPGDGSLKNAIYTIYGKAYAEAVLPLDFGDNIVKAEGFTGKSNISRPNRNYQSFFVNNRNIKSRLIAAALEEAYKNQLMGGKFPFAVLKLSVNAAFVDVNVHPNKTEVKFSDEKKVFNTVYWAVKNALYEKPFVPRLDLTARKQTYFRNSQAPTETGYVQGKIDTDSQTGQGLASAPDRPVGGGAKQEQEGIPYAKASCAKPGGQRFHQSASELYRTAPLTLPEEDKNNVSDAEAVKAAEACQTKEACVHEAAGEPAAQTVVRGPEINLAQEANNFKITGQIFNTYIIVECGSDMLLIDQHAAHERLKYEQLLAGLAEGGVVSQTLVAPVMVDLTPAEFALVKENLEFFDKIGFEIEDFGNHTIVIQLTPVNLSPDELSDLFVELLGQIAGFRSEAVGEKQQRALYTVACKAAIKANRNMKQSEMEALVSDVLALKGINTCPHGRPVMISLTKHGLEKQFKRII